MKVETPRSCTSPRTHGPLALGFVATLLLASAARDGLAQSPPAAPTSTEQTPPAATAPTSTAPASTASTAPAATAPAASTAPASTAPTAPTAPASTTTAASTATAPASTALASTAPPPPAATAPAPAPTAAPAIVAEATPPPLPQVPPPFATPPVTTGMADIAGLVAKVRPSVVNITSTHQIRAPHFDFDWPFGPNPFGHGRRGHDHGAETLRQQSLGSGFIIDPQGHVVTNAHVVEDADTVRVKLADDREFDAKVKGRDARLDVAILELQGAKDLQPVSLGSSDALRVGEYVVAIGNPFGLGDTVTLGIVSAKGRALGAGPYDDFIQTDASINPGNSGGPLFDLRGQMVGINTAINPEGKGIGFAIPIDDVKDVLPQLLANGHVAHGRLGVSIQPVNGTLAKALGMTHAKGALVGEVESGGPADKAGLKPGDVIVSVDQTEITHSTDLPRIIARHAPSSKVTLEVIRAGALQTFEVTLGQLKDDDDSTQPSSAEGAPSSQPQQQQPTTPPSPPKEPREAQLGLSLSDASNGHGALVDKVKPGSAAEETLESGDVITEVNHTPVTTGADAAKAFESAPKDVPVLLRVDRNGTQRYIAVQHH